MTHQLWFICDCGSRYDLEEATRLGMSCPACSGTMQRLDSEWAVNNIRTKQNNRSVPMGTDRRNSSAVAIITLPSRNETDVEGVADLVRSFPMPISLEIFARGDHRYFLIRGNRETLAFTAERLESVYPKLQVQITEEDPVAACFDQADETPLGSWIEFSKPGWLPIRTWKSFTHGSDPVVNLLSAFSGLMSNDGVWMQLNLNGEGAPEWEERVQKRLKVESQRGYLVDESASMVSSPVQVRQPQDINYRAVGMITAGLFGFGLAVMLFTFGYKLLAVLLSLIVVGVTIFLLEWFGRWGEDEWDRTDLRLVREKVVNSHILIKASLRVVAVAEQPERSLALLRRFTSTLNQYSVSGGNSLVSTQACQLDNQYVWTSNNGRQDPAPVLWLSPLEAAGLWHPPLLDKRTSMDGIKVNTIAFRAPSPEDIHGLAPIGSTRLPGGNEFLVELNAKALRRGITMIGKPGMGKSILMEHIVKISAEEDPEQPAVIVIDPHGDLAERLLGVLSPEVVRDRVYYLDVAAKDYIMTYNPLDPTQEGLDAQAIAQIFMDIGQALFGKYWGPRMQIPYKRTILTVALANEKRGRGNMFGPNLITPFLMADKELWLEFIRQEIGETDDLADLLNMYYQGQLAHINRHLKQQVIMPVLSKSDRFAEEPANSLYNAPASDLDLWEVIRNRKILIINTRSGIIGEDMAAFTGALFINAVVKIVMHQIANRVRDRVPITFVVDEMQTIAGVQWDTILGQMRKHGFNLVIGTQSLASIRENLGQNMPGIILGGSHSLFSFRVNGEDAEKLSEEEFRTEDGGVDPTSLTQMPPYHVWASMVGQNGEKIPPFSMRILPPLESSEEQIQGALDARAAYSTPVTIASRQGMESLTYIRDSFGRVISEGAGSSGGSREDRNRGVLPEITEGLIEAFVSDDNDESPDADLYNGLMGDALSLFDGDDFS